MVWLALNEAEGFLKTVLSEHYVSFVDIMFAVMVAQSFISFKEELFAPSFDLLVLLLSYFTIITSWLFYHRSVKALPEEEWWRFGVDVVILFVYFILISTHKNFGTIVVFYPILWTLYLVWDWLKSKEYTQKSVDVSWSVPFVLVLVVIAAFNIALATAYVLFWAKWVELAALFVTVLIYRIKQPTP
jgi:hypothetical protein